MRTEHFFVEFMGASVNTYLGGDGRRYFGDKRRASKVAPYAWPHVAPFDYPVKLTFTPVLSARRRSFDVTNFGCVNKIIEDCMVQSGLLVDDTKDYVYEVTTKRPQRSPDQREGMLVTVEECSPVPLRTADLEFRDSPGWPGYSVAE